LFLFVFFLWQVDTHTHGITHRRKTPHPFKTDFGSTPANELELRPLYWPFLSKSRVSHRDSVTPPLSGGGGGGGGGNEMGRIGKGEGMREA